MTTGRSARRAGTFFADAEFLGSLASDGTGDDPLARDWEWARSHMMALVSFTREFTAAFSRAKRELGGVDFADLEQCALRLLRNPATVREWRSRLAHVFVDEYQDINEAQDTNSPWLPTLTFRAGAVLPGTVNEEFDFAPGLRSAAIEPEFLLRKHFGWPGLGVYGDALYRWNRTTGNDQYITAIGLFQQIKGWELDAGYRHLQTLSGTDISFADPNNLATLDYPRDAREISDAIEAGFSYTTSKRHFRYGFQTRTVFDGINTDRKFWIGASIDIPIGGKHED